MRRSCLRNVGHEWSECQYLRCELVRAAAVRQGKAGAFLVVREATDVMEESWPSGVCLQGSASNHSRVALAEDRCRERRERRCVHEAHQVWIRKTSTSEPAFRHRN